MRQQLLELRKQAHHLKPVVIIGAQGLTEAVHDAINTAIEAHELMKIRINANSHEQRVEMVKAICAEHQATLVQQIGHTATIYRKNPDTK